MEGVECVCMGRGRVCAYGRVGVCVHGEREGVYMEGVECAWGEGVYMEGFGCACMERGRVCIYMEGFGCACMGRGRVCIWKGSSVHAWGRGSVCAYGRF